MTWWNRPLKRGCAGPVLGLEFAWEGSTTDPTAALQQVENHLGVHCCVTAVVSATSMTA